MTSALIVNKFCIYELECTDGYRLFSIGDQAIVVRDTMGDTIGVIPHGDPKTLWLIELATVAGSHITTYLEKGTLYSDDPKRDGIEVVLEHVIIE